MTGATLVSVTPEERQTGSLHEDKLPLLLQDMHHYGFCLLGPVISEGALEQLGTDLDLICAGLAATQVLERPPQERSWHLGAGVPRSAPFMHEDFVVNPLIEHAVVTLLGKGAFMNFCNANTNATCPSSGPRAEGSDIQGLHGDGRWAFVSPEEAREAGDSRWPHGPTQVVVNFGSEMCNEDNGATEIWPGSHAVEEVIAIENGGPSSSKGPNSLKQLADMRANGADPIAAVIPRGAVLIRDVRLWHRGIHNPADHPRHMVAVCYSSASVRDRCIVNSTSMSKPDEDRSQLRCQGGFSPPLDKMRFSDSCRALFERPSCHGVDRNVELVPGLCDNWGRSVDTLAVAPKRVIGADGEPRWEFTNAATHSAQGVPIDAMADRRRVVLEQDLPRWAVRVFSQHVRGPDNRALVAKL